MITGELKDQVDKIWTVGDEVRMQCCLAGSGRRTFSTLITIFIGVVSYPELWRDFWKAYQRGTRMDNFSG